MVTTKDSIIRLEEIEKRFSNRPALNKFSAQARSGDRILVTGPNGSGKTTLLRIMANLLKPDQGRVFCSKKISWLPTTESGLWARLSGLESLELYAQLWKVSTVDFKNQIDSWSHWPAFQESLQIPTQNLSTGRRQLLHFARLLFNKPQLILMDEPFRSLDSENMAFVIKQFALWAPEAAIIWSSPQLPPHGPNSFHHLLWSLKESA